MGLAKAPDFGLPDRSSVAAMHLWCSAALCCDSAIALNELHRKVGRMNLKH